MEEEEEVEKERKPAMDYRLQWIVHFIVRESGCKDHPKWLLLRIEGTDSSDGK